MKHVNSGCCFLALIMMSLFAVAAENPTRFYVATYGDDSNAGTSWDCPFRTIEAGVAAVKTGAGEKELIISNGTYVLTQTIGTPTSGSVAMRSLTGDPKDVIIDAGERFPIAYYNGGAGSSFRGITFINGKTSDSYATSKIGGLHLRAQVNMYDCIISNCVTTVDNGQGGGLYYVGYGSELRNVTILNCSAATYGGGAYIGSYGGAPSIDGMVVSNCTLVGTSSYAREGAGLRLYGDNSEGRRILASNVVIGNCHILNLSDQNAMGAGLYAAKSDCRNFTISDCSIVDNELATIPTKVFVGGGAYLNDASLYDSVVTNCVLSRQNNTCQGGSNGKADGERGGGVYAAWNNNVPEEYRTIISNCVITCCAATNDYNGIGQGGGVYLCGSQAGGPLLCDSLITGNRAGQCGAGAFVQQNSDATIVRCEFSGNVIAPLAYQMNGESRADVAGGGTAIASYGSVVVSGCRIKENRGAAEGTYQIHNSAVQLRGKTGILINCDFNGNYGYNEGAALSTRGLTGDLIVSNCVFRGNICEGNGGVVFANHIVNTNLFADCSFSGNRSTGYLFYLCPQTAAALYHFRNSRFTGNDCSCVLYQLSLSGDSSHHLTVENCTIVSNRCSGASNMRTSHSSRTEGWAGMKFVGSVLLFNRLRDFDDYHNDIQKCCSEAFPGTIGDEAGNIVYDPEKPLFVDLAGGDLRPARKSQLCDRVARAAWMGDGSKNSAFDMGSGCDVVSFGRYGVAVKRVNAVPRLQGGFADIGCGEYRPTTGFSLVVR